MSHAGSGQKFLSLLALLPCLVWACGDNAPPQDPDAGLFRIDAGFAPDATVAKDMGIMAPEDLGVANPDSGADAGQPDLGTPDMGTAMLPDGGMTGPDCHDIEFRLQSPNAQSVWVTGSFSNWGATPADGALELTQAADGWWSLTHRNPMTGRYEYKFIVDTNSWLHDPNNPESVDDGHGGQNSVLWVCTSACGDLSAFDWKDTVMYFALVDRFTDGDGQVNRVSGASGGNARTGPSGDYEGGDLRGLTQKIPYLDQLGVTSLWLSAPYENRNSAGAAIDPNSDNHMYSAYHGYWPSPANIDYSNPNSPTPTPQVESRIGTDADLRQLITTAHQTIGANGHGMKVLFDYVMNHVDIESGLYQAHQDWFARRDGNFALCGPDNLWDDPYWGVRCAFTNYLPPFDFDIPAARDWSVKDALWWAKNYQIDGYRLDAIKHVPLSWLTALRAELNRELTNPAGGRFYLVGETFAYDDRPLLKRFIDPSTMLDGQFDFPFKARLCEAVFTDGGSLGDFSRWMDGNDSFYGPGAVMTTWIGNHDIPRAIHFASRQIGNCREGSHPGNGWTQSFAQPTDAVPYERLGVAFAIMMTNPGIPLIYYGDEVGLAGGGDPDNRRMMPADNDLNAHQRTLRDRIAKLGQIRGENLVLGRGTRTTLSQSRDTWVYEMSGCGAGAKGVIVAVNKADEAREVVISSGQYDDLLNSGSFGGGRLQIAPRSYHIYRRQ